MIVKVSMAADCALGNGTRPAGQSLAEFEGESLDGQDLVAAAWEANAPSEIVWPDGVSLVGGDATNYELFTALRSPLVQFANQSAIVDAAKTWRDLPVEELPIETRKDENVEALRAAGLMTVGDVAIYGEQHKGLTSIKGIGEASEQVIKAALAAVADKE